MQFIGKPRVLGLALAMAGLAGCHHAFAPVPESNVAAHDGRLVLPAVPGNPGAAYFDIANPTATPITITSVAISSSASASMHQTAGGTMLPLASVVVPAKETITFAPGGRHVMVFGLSPSLKPGDRADIAITCKGVNGTVQLDTTLKVEPAGGDPMAEMKMN